MAKAPSFFAAATTCSLLLVMCWVQGPGQAASTAVGATPEERIPAHADGHVTQNHVEHMDEQCLTDAALDSTEHVVAGTGLLQLQRIGSGQVVEASDTDSTASRRRREPRRRRRQPRRRRRSKPRRRRSEPRRRRRSEPRRRRSEPRRRSGSSSSPSPTPSPSRGRVSVALTWETGTVDSGLAAPLKPSFSKNKNGWTPPKDPQGKDCQTGKVSASNCWPESIGLQRVGTSLHYLSVEKVDWAKDGDYVLKVYGDGSNYGKSGDWAFRSELSAVQDEYIFHEGDYQYFSMSFWLDESWDQVTDWSTLIAQWKMSPGHPHAAVRMSNEGDYKLYFKGDRLWKHDGPLDTRHGGRYLGKATPQAWNDIKIFFKKSQRSDGFARVWLNGAPVFEHTGATLLHEGRGYTKFGMYTNIMDKRTIFFDAVSFCHSASREECLDGKSLDEWVASGAAAPSPAARLAPSPSPVPSPGPAPSPSPTPSPPAPTPASGFSARRRESRPGYRMNNGSPRRRTSCNENPARKGAKLSFDDGTVESGLSCPLEESYSENKGKNPSSDVKKGSKGIEASRLHYVDVVKVDWAKDGEYVLKAFADGSNRPRGRSPYANRAELGSVYNCYIFQPKEEFYYSASFWPDDSWRQVSKYSTIITQFKMSGGYPHALLRLSNEGNYELFFGSHKNTLWEPKTGAGRSIGHAAPNAWNDVKIYAKWSTGSDGIIKVWLQGTQVFEHRGRTLLTSRSRGGYVKFGMYTEIYDKRTIYFDAVSFSNYLDIPLEQWLRDQPSLPQLQPTTVTASNATSALTTAKTTPSTTV